MKNKIEIISYNFSWPQVYAQEKIRIINALGDESAAIHHIGSTSILNMPAKPIIDIMIELKNLDQIQKVKGKLIPLGFHEMHRQIIPHRSFFTSRSDENIGFNLHIYEQGDPQVRRHISFRNYLISHANEAQDYAQLKKTLASIHCEDRLAYVSGKDQFVQSIDVKAKKWDAEHHLPSQLLPPAVMLDENAWPAKKLLNCIEANFNVSKTFHAQYMNNVVLIRKPGYTLVNKKIKDVHYNCVIDADFSKEKADVFINEVMEQFNQIPTSYCWWISPSDQPPNLASLLEAHHYKKVASPQIYSINCQTLNIENISAFWQVKNVLEDNVYADFQMLMTQGNDQYFKYFQDLKSIITSFDPIEFFVLYNHGKPMACSQVCYYAGVANIQIITSLPSAEIGKFIFDFHLQQAKNKKYLFAYTYAEFSINDLTQLSWQTNNKFIGYQR